MVAELTYMYIYIYVYMYMFLYIYIYMMIDFEENMGTKIRVAKYIDHGKAFLDTHRHFRLANENSRNRQSFTGV